MSKKLSDDLRDAVIAKHASGWSLQRCADWLARSHNVSITKQSLSETIRNHRSSLADASKASARAATGPAVAKAMKSLTNRVDRATKIVTKAETLALKDPLSGVDPYAKAVTAYAKLNELLQRASGMDQLDEQLDGLAGLLGLAFGEPKKS